jgi:hypothetical protein
VAPELILILTVFLFVFGVHSTTKCIPILDRPGLFLGRWGEGFFLAVCLSIPLLTLSLVVWSFIQITWYVNIMLLIGTAVVASIALYFLPVILVFSALGPIISTIGLIILHNIAWFGGK